MDWFKFYGKDFLADAKVRCLSVTHRLMWVYLLCRASDSEDGSVTFVTEDTLREDCGLYPNMPNGEEESVEGFFDLITKMDMVERLDDNTIRIKNYEKRQNTQLTDAERSKRYRDKKKHQVNERDDRHATSVTNDTVDKNRIDKRRVDKNRVTTEQTHLAQALLKRWNDVHGTKYTAWKPLVKNLDYWKDQYSAEQILEAITAVKSDAFWRDKMTPTIFLRTKNQAGEPVDYISQLLHGRRGITKI